MPIRDGDDVQDTWGNRIAARKATLQSGALTIKGMDRVKAALLMLHSYRTRKPVDKETVTLLDDDSALSDSWVPYANLVDHDGRPLPTFNADGPGSRHVYARFRSSVGGDMLLA